MSDIKFPGKASDFLKIGVAAAGRGDLDSVRAILKARPKWIHRIGSHGRTMLWEAAHRGKLDMVKYLVRRKADINACGTYYTPYFVEVSCYCIARFKKRDDVADFLLNKGAKLNIHTAAFLGDLAGVKKFLSRSKKRLNEGHPQYVMADKDAPVSFYIEPAEWATPLCYALRGGSEETVRFLIEKGATIRGNEKSLFIAADDSAPMVRLLLQNGADPAFAPRTHPDDVELYKVVSAFGVKRPSKKSESEELVYLCRGDRGGNPKEVALLLKHGADVNHQDHKGKTALHRAAKAGFIDTIKVLLEHGATVDVADLKGETALFDAVRSTIKDVEKKKKTIRLLKNAGSDRTHSNNRGQTAIDVAKAGKHAESKEIARLLSRK